MAKKDTKNKTKKSGLKMRKAVRSNIRQKNKAVKRTANKKDSLLKTAGPAKKRAQKRINKRKRLDLKIASNKKSASSRKKSVVRAPTPFPFVNIKVVGIGGAGGNIISRLNSEFPRGVDFIAINTDHQDLENCVAKHKIYIGKNLTRGLGTGMNPDLGRQAAEENRSEIAEALKGADLVFVVAGMGGGTGSSVSVIVSEIAKQNDSLVIAFVTKPFSFEGNHRYRIAEEWISKLKDKVDISVIVPNDRIFSIVSKDTSVLKAFSAVDNVLRNALRGIIELIAMPGIINLDFADIRSVIQDAGMAVVGVGISSGQDRAINAVKAALHSPLIEVNPEGAKGVILGISGTKDIKMNEINEAAKFVAQEVDPEARIIFGAYYDRHLKPNQIKVTVIAAGLNGTSSQSLFDSESLGKYNFWDGKDIGDGKAISSEKNYDKKKDGGNDRKQNGAGKSISKGKEEKSEDIWDIPTFLRKKKKK